jgi:hypothetical protein
MPANNGATAGCEPRRYEIRVRGPIGREAAEIARKTGAGAKFWASGVSADSRKFRPIRLRLASKSSLPPKPITAQRSCAIAAQSESIDKDCVGPSRAGHLRSRMIR